MKKVLPKGTSLIPDNATKVFDGEIFDVWQWPQVMFDGSTKTFEMLRRQDTVQVLVVKDDQILLVEDEQPGRGLRVHFPGGRSDDEDESWLAAAQRELLEETGLICKNWRLIDVKQPSGKIEWFAPLYLATDIISQTEASVDAGGERIKPVWRSFEDVRSLVLSGQLESMQYLVPFFNMVPDLGALLGLPEFIGIEVDR